MWRSLLGQSQLLSRLRRPVAAANPTRILSLRAYCCTNTQLQADVDVDDDGAAAEKRMSSSSSSFRQCFCGGLDQLVQPQPQRRRQRHLYVVLEKMKTGLSLYKLNLEDLDGGDEDAFTTMAAAVDTAGPPRMLLRRLPDPVLRLGFQSINPSNANFEALGTKIVATCYSNKRTLVYDTTTARLDIVGSRLPADIHHRYHAVAAGDKLYTMDSSGGRVACLRETRLAWLGPESDGGYDSGDDMRLFSVRGQTQEWTWKSLPWPVPRAAGNHITSYALHPDGRTIFVSFSSTFSLDDDETERRASAYYTERRASSTTFSLDTESGEWMRRGDWRLPFCGRAYYDGDLDAWVGLRGSIYYGDGVLCACDVPAALGGGGEAPTVEPAWKQQLAGKEKKKLTFLEAPSLVANANECRRLVHTGRGRFCLVEMAPAPEPEGAATKTNKRCRECHNDGWTYVLHVTMFRAKHGKNGELVATPCRPGRRAYVLHNHVPLFFDAPPAFWI